MSRIKQDIRVIIFLAIILALVLSISIYSHIQMTYDTDLLITNIFDIENSLLNNDYTNASAKMKEMIFNWRVISKRWCIISAHSEMDTLDTSIARLNGFMALENTSMCLSETSVIKRLLTFMHEKERPNLQNIL